MTNKKSGSKGEGTPNEKKSKQRKEQRKAKVTGIPRKKAAEND